MTNKIIQLSNVRLSFPHIAEPQKTVDSETGKERISWSCDFIMEPSHSGYVEFMKVYAEMALLKWKELTPNVMKLIQDTPKKRCYGVGDDKFNQKTFKKYDGYEGMVFITAISNKQPQVFDSLGKMVDPLNAMAYTQEARRLYAGCRVNAAIKPWLQDNKFGRTIRCELMGIQFLADDSAFGEKGPDLGTIFGDVSNASSSLPSFLIQ